MSENAEYKEALEAMSLMEDRIEKLEDIIKRVVIIEKSSGSNVQLGSAVKIKKKLTEKFANMFWSAKKRLMCPLAKFPTKSPIGSALMGKKRRQGQSRDSRRGN